MTKFSHDLIVLAIANHYVTGMYYAIMYINK